MRVIIGSDHGGFSEKASLTTALQAEGYTVVDVGPHTMEPEDDYPGFAVLVGKEIQKDSEARGILLCRSGEGMAMAANKVSGVRAALVWRPEVATETRQHNDANIVVLPADFLNEAELLSVTKAFLETPFSGDERHVRRIGQMTALELEHP